MSKENTFSSEEKLKSRKAIQQLFDDGISLKDYPLVVVYQKVNSEVFFVRIAVSVSKKNFKRAVDRNRVKRLIREAYRLNKKEFLSKAKSSNISFNAMFIYSNNKLPTFDEVNKKIVGLLDKLSKKI